MKKLISLLFFVGLYIIGHAQAEHMIPKEKWSKDFYISDEFCATKGLKPGETNGMLRVWNSVGKGSDVSRVVDIRWYFATAREALQYLKDNLSDLSEQGDSITEKIIIDSVSNLAVYKEGAGMRKMNEALGIKMKMYFFLFTVKNYLAKVFVSSEKDLTVADALLFAKEAAKRLNSAAK